MCRNSLLRSFERSRSAVAVRHDAGDAAELVYVHVAAVILSNQLWTPQIYLCCVRRQSVQLNTYQPVRRTQITQP